MSLERRSEPRYPKAFAFWVRPLGTMQRTSAWMLDMSTRGAAFLTATDEAPLVGARIEFIEMQTPDRMVREDAGPLPRFARVLRHDGASGLTRRVAVQFEADARAEHDVRQRRVATMMCPRGHGVPPLVPPNVPPPAQVHSGVARASG
jgi:hypothetical protein